MYHLWCGLDGAVVVSAASDMSLTLAPDASLRTSLTLALTPASTSQEEQHGDGDHDGDHHRGDPGLAAAGPGDLAAFGADFAEELRQVSGASSAGASAAADGAAITAAVLAARLRIADGLVPGFLAMAASSNSRFS